MHANEATIIVHLSMNYYFFIFYSIIMLMLVYIFRLYHFSILILEDYSKQTPSNNTCTINAT
jgi:cell division protein FtsI/penicillin-binding protein 2